MMNTFNSGYESLLINKLNKMKKKLLLSVMITGKILIVLLLIIFTSCSKDDQALCNCYTITQAVYHQPANVTTMTVQNLCTGEIKEIEAKGYYEINKQYCE